jgi:hypothetical protein
LLIDVLTDPSGRTVTWSYDAQHTTLGHPTATIAGRAAIRRTAPAEPECARHGGTRELITEVSGTSGARNVRELILDACIGGPNDSPTQRELDAMLASLRGAP